MTNMKYALAALLGIVIVIAVAFSLHAYIKSTVDEKLERTALTLDAHIAEQELLLNTLADLTGQLEADDITKRIVVDCAVAERQRFDQLLGQLSGVIGNPELRELDSLFYKCGSYYADRKSVMASRLLREVEVYRGYLALQSQIVGESDTNQDNLNNWQQVADMEMQLANHFNELVRLQGDIILTLLAGKSRTSPEITGTLDEVSRVRGEMAVLTQQIERIRSELRTL